MPLGLIALALGGFSIGLAEFVIMGLLPEVAADFRISEASAGWLISGYALAVVVGALGLTMTLSRLDRKPTLAILLVLFVAGNFVSASATGYGMMMVGRIMAALAQGAFFGIGAVVAADMVSANKKAGAIAIMFTGVTAATVVGVPLGTMLGQAAGWRATFWAIVILGLAALMSILALVPETRRVSTRATTLSSELQAFRTGQVWLSIWVTILGYGGIFGAFTFIAFTLTKISGFSPSAVPWLLILFGVGLCVGNTLGARAADRNLDRTLLVALSMVVIILVVFALTASNQLVTTISIALLGGFGFATVPGLQMRVMNYASSAPTLASGVNIAAFNVGNAVGAWLGGATISGGLGYGAPIWAGACLTFSGLVVMLIAAAFAKRASRLDLATLGCPQAADQPITVTAAALGLSPRSPVQEADGNDPA